MYDLSDILKDLSAEQEAACKASENILLTACPGSGKTRTLTRRLAYLNFLTPPSKKWNIAITYTNRAAEEIGHRLNDMGVNLSNVWTGTIHQFCMQFIIRPYSMYSSRLSKGYTIIDEFIRDEYCKAIDERLKIKKNCYDNPFQYPELVRAYEDMLRKNKEIDFDMILRLSEELLISHPFICINIGSVLHSILVDEFQDTRELQYSILAKIYKANKKINLTFVGDVNQAIYSSLEACTKTKEELDSLYETKFKALSLTGCYRSTQRIVDVYKQFEVTRTGNYSVAKIQNDYGNIEYSCSTTKESLSTEIADIIRVQLASGIKAEEICVVAPQWHLLFKISQDLRSMLPDISFDAPDISPIKYDPMNPLCLLAKLIFTPAGKNVSVRKRTATEFISIIRNDYQIPVAYTIEHYDILSAINFSRTVSGDGIELYKRTINKVFDLMKIDISKEEALTSSIEKFYQKIEFRTKQYSLPTDYNSISKYFREKRGVVVSTIHGVKGEEYTSVIAFGLLNGYLPHWNSIYNCSVNEKKESCKLLYVLCSRAKKNLYLISERGRLTKKQTELLPTHELTSPLIGYVSTTRSISL